MRKKICNNRAKENEREMDRERERSKCCIHIVLCIYFNYYYNCEGEEKLQTRERTRLPKRNMYIDFILIN